MSASRSAQSGGDGVDIRPHLRAVGRHKGLVAAIAITTTALALGVAVLKPKAYESSTRLLIDPRGLQVMDREATPRASSSEQGQSVVESELRSLTSDVVLREVIRRLKLTDDAELNGSKRYLWSPVTDAIGAVKDGIRRIIGGEELPADPELAVLRNMQRMVKAKREPLSFVVEMTVTTEDGAKSASIANAITAAYLDTRFSAQSSATQRASDTMSGRLAELRRNVEAAEERAERYKRENDIVGASGRLVNEQQLSELNSQLVTARAETQKATTKLDQIKRIKQTGVDPESIDEALRSDVVGRLRTQYAALRRREASLGATLLPNHPVLKEVRQEIAQTKQSITQEIGRIADAAQLELERARNNEKQLEKSLADLKGVAGSTNEKLVKLRELDREVEAARQVYASFLVRSRELGEQRRVDTSNVVTLSEAVPPRTPAGVPAAFIALAGLFAGLGLGVGGALVSDRRDAIVRDREHLKMLTGDARTVVIGDIAKALGPIGKDGAPDLPSFVVSSPSSEASLAMIRLASEITAEANREGVVALVTAAGPDEGKSTVAVNLALAAAKAGARTLLIDGDTDGRTLSALMGAGNNAGLADLLGGTAQAETAILKIDGLGLDVLPAGRPGTGLPMRAGRNLDTAIARLVQTYDLIVVDGGLVPTGRLLPVWARIASETLLVARSGQSNRMLVGQALASLEAYPARYTRPVLLAD